MSIVAGVGIIAAMALGLTLPVSEALTLAGGAVTMGGLFSIKGKLAQDCSELK